MVGEEAGNVFKPSRNPIHHLKNYAAEHYEGQIYPDHITDEKREELTKDWKQFSREFAKLIDEEFKKAAKPDLKVKQET